MAVVNPWKTTSLKLLTQLKWVDVEKNLNKFIDLIFSWSHLVVWVKTFQVLNQQCYLWC